MFNRLRGMFGGRSGPEVEASLRAADGAPGPLIRLEGT